MNFEAESEENSEIYITQNEKVITIKSNELHQIAGSIKAFCPELEKKQIMQYANIIYKESKKYRYDWRLIVAIMKTESNFNEQAKSHKGAVGLMQLMPKTAKWLSPKLEIEYSGIGSLYDPEYNIKLGVHYLNMMQNKFGDLDMALVAYNKGPKKLMNELDKGENLNSRFLEKVKAYYSDLKSTTEDYPA
jgi:soluble lytic murein transglycosylase